MDYDRNEAPEIRIAPTEKSIKDVPKRTEAKRESLVNMTKDELMEFAAQNTIGLMSTFNKHLFKTDNAYEKEFLIYFMYGQVAYNMLGFRDIKFPVEEFLDSYHKKLSQFTIRKTILGQ